jgi:hypothetical protein
VKTAVQELWPRRAVYAGARAPPTFLEDPRRSTTSIDPWPTPPRVIIGHPVATSSRQGRRPALIGGRGAAGDVAQHTLADHSVDNLATRCQYIAELSRFRWKVGQMSLTLSIAGLFLSVIAVATSTLLLVRALVALGLADSGDKS